MAKPQVVIIEFADSLGNPQYGVGLRIEPNFGKVVRLDSFESHLEAEDFALVIASHGDCEFTKEEEVHIVDLGYDEEEVEFVELVELCVE